MTMDAEEGPERFDLESWLGGLSGPPPIVQVGAHVLRARAVDVPRSVLGTAAFEQLLRVMVDVMRRAPGVGLAAPQIGIPWRVFVAEDDEERIAQLPEEVRESRGRVALPLTAMINPTVEPEGDAQAVFIEGCLSMRGYAALVPRWAAVTVRALDEKGRPMTRRFEGWPARIMQHENDHLGGTLYVDRMLSRSLASPEELPRLAGLSVQGIIDDLDVQRR